MEGSAEGSVVGQAAGSVEGQAAGSVERARRRRLHHRWNWKRARAAGRAEDGSPQIGAPCPTNKSDTGMIANTRKDKRLCRCVLSSGSQYLLIMRERFFYFQ
jgi:hypothetical protein